MLDSCLPSDMLHSLTFPDQAPVSSSPPHGENWHVDTGRSSAISELLLTTDANARSEGGKGTVKLAGSTLQSHRIDANKKLTPFGLIRFVDCCHVISSTF